VNCNVGMDVEGSVSGRPPVPSFVGRGWR